MSSSNDQLDPIDLSTWPEKNRKVVEQLRDLLTELNPARLDEHHALLPTLPDSIGDFEHLIAPAAYAFLAYQRSGLAALYQLGVADAHSAAFVVGPVLLAAAVRDKAKVEQNVYLAQRYLTREAYERLKERVITACDDPELSSEARRYVSRLLAHYASEQSRRHQLASVLSGLTFTGGRETSATQLVWDVMATATLQISDELCSEAADLVAQDLNETEYQAFFEKHPALLDPLAATIVPRQVLADMWRTDFVIRRFDDQYVFVELEKPRDVLFTAYPQPSAALSHALGQVFSWFAWVEDNIAYASTHGFPNIHAPRGLIVIGRDGDLSAEQRRMLRLMNDLVNHRVLIWTYDEVIRNAKNVVRNLTSRVDSNI